jgi:hypothetical protein
MKIPDELQIPATVFTLLAIMLAGFSLILFVMLPN